MYKRQISRKITKDLADEWNFKKKEPVIKLLAYVSFAIAANYFMSLNDFFHQKYPHNQMWWADFFITKSNYSKQSLAIVYTWVCLESGKVIKKVTKSGLSEYAYLPLATTIKVDERAKKEISLKIFDEPNTFETLSIKEQRKLGLLPDLLSNVIIKK